MTDDQQSGDAETAEDETQTGSLANSSGVLERTEDSEPGQSTRLDCPCGDLGDGSDTSSERSSAAAEQQEPEPVAWRYPWYHTQKPDIDEVRKVSISDPRDSGLKTDGRKDVEPLFTADQLRSSDDPQQGSSQQIWMCGEGHIHYECYGECPNCGDILLPASPAEIWNTAATVEQQRVCDRLDQLFSSELRDTEYTVAYCHGCGETTDPDLYRHEPRGDDEVCQNCLAPNGEARQDCPMCGGDGWIAPQERGNCPACGERQLELMTVLPKHSTKRRLRDDLPDDADGDSGG